MSSTRLRLCASRHFGAVASRLGGYGLSVVALALASLAMIPAMIHADGAHAWAAVAVGQAVGGLAAVVIAYGWGMTGPAQIAAAEPSVQRSVYVESLRVKLCLSLPAGAGAAALAIVLVPQYAVHGAMGALAMSSVGLSANWFFGGIRAPYRQFAAETLPRVVGTSVGIGLMYSGSSAVAGVVCQLLGMLLGFAIATSWILLAFPRGGAVSPFRYVFAVQGKGLTSTMLSAAYVAAPLMIVTQVAPGVLPVFAIIDKVQRQIAVGLGPVIVVAQSWVPRGGDQAAVHQRARQSVSGALVVGLLFGAVTVAFAPFLTDWLTQGAIDVRFASLVLAGAFVATSFAESVVSKAVMPAIDRVGVTVKAASFSIAIGLPLVALGATFFGVNGALMGVVVGLLVRFGIELSSIHHASVPEEDPFSPALHRGELSS